VPSGVGPRALIVTPSGSAALVTLPAEPAAMAAAINAAVGGYFGAPVGGGDWIAYAAEDPDPGTPPNFLADTLARQLGGWHAEPGPIMTGVVVFLGRSGSQEVDVPARLMGIADDAPPEPRRPIMRLRIRLYIAGRLADEQWIGQHEPEPGQPHGPRVDGAIIAARHRELVEAAEAAGQSWQVEAFDPGSPDGEQYYRFGTDAAGMVTPMAIIPGPPGHPPQSAN
jgi:hypothetical protein